MIQRALTVGLALLPVGVCAQNGWVLYPPENEAEVSPDPNTSGTEYLNSLLGPYAYTFHDPGNPNVPRTIEDKQARCASHLRQIEGQMAYALHGFSYKLSLEIEAADGPLKGTSCRVQTQRDTQTTIEVMSQ